MTLVPDLVEFAPCCSDARPINGGPIQMRIREELGVNIWKARQPRATRRTIMSGDRTTLALQPPAAQWSTAKTAQARSTNTTFQTHQHNGKLTEALT